MCADIGFPVLSPIQDKVIPNLRDCSRRSGNLTSCLNASTLPQARHITPRSPTHGVCPCAIGGLFKKNIKPLFRLPKMKRLFNIFSGVSWIIQVLMLLAWMLILFALPTSTWNKMTSLFQWVLHGEMMSRFFFFSESFDVHTNENWCIFSKPGFLPKAMKVVRRPINMRELF